MRGGGLYFIDGGGGAGVGIHEEGRGGSAAMADDVTVAKDVEGDVLRVAGQIAPLDADAVGGRAEGDDTAVEAFTPQTSVVVSRLGGDGQGKDE